MLFSDSNTTEIVTEVQIFFKDLNSIKNIAEKKSFIIIYTMLLLYEGAWSTRKGR